ncbi:store-operated calcium entry-associated regulatory factor isoform X2 [Clinocottus analis]|uniref:store-operated calcium entry-associated regulatory factor isoform X2 n=1 Tax=Clinocottus analis TaxID=304258 RepID=UPI0035BF5A7B
MTRRQVIVMLQFLLVGHIKSWDHGGVLLRDVQALTLYKDRYTTARRSSPVPQLQCVGGSAGCQAYVPEVVQCQNKGWDGVDVQWECKSDMDNAYRFGRIEVSCEGYSNPADALILKGSCGLEYTLELTEEGRRTSQGRGGSQGGFKGFGGLRTDDMKLMRFNLHTKTYLETCVFFLSLSEVSVALPLVSSVLFLETSTNAISPARRVIRAPTPQAAGTQEVFWWSLCYCSWLMVSTSCSSVGTRTSGSRTMDRQVTPAITTMVSPQDHRPRDSNLTSQAILVSTKAMVSIVTTLKDNSTQEAKLLLAQAVASGPAWEQEGCWDISLVVREASPTTMTTPLLAAADVLLLVASHLPLGHALLQVLEEPREDKSCGVGQLMYETKNIKRRAQWMEVQI